MAQPKTAPEHVAAPGAKGPRVLAGGRPRPDLGPYFYEPTILTDVTPEMTCYANETFGPVVSLYPFTTDDEAIQLANATEYGLNASILTRHVPRPRALAPRTRPGTVNLHDAGTAA